MKVSKKMEKAISKVEKILGEMKKDYFVERDESCRVGRGFYDGCELSSPYYRGGMAIIVNHNGEIFW